MTLQEIEQYVSSIMTRIRDAAAQEALHAGAALSEADHTAFAAIGALASTLVNDVHRIANALEVLASPAWGAVEHAGEAVVHDALAGADMIVHTSEPIPAEGTTVVPAPTQAEVDQAALDTATTTAAPDVAHAAMIGG